MDRKSNSRIGIVGVLCAIALLLTAVQSFGVVTNGFFDSSLENWNYSNDNSVVWSPAYLSAEMNESGALVNSRLWQQFLVGDENHPEMIFETLTFTVRTPQPGSGETDYFYIGLFHENDVPLLDESNSFFHWDSDDGETGSDPQYFDYEFIDDPEGGLLYNFTIPVTMGDNMTLLFQLDHCWGTIDPDTGNISDPVTVIQVDNVQLHGTSSTPVVPVPGASGLAVVGLVVLGFFKKKLS